MDTVTTDEKKPPEGVGFLSERLLQPPSQVSLEQELNRIDTALNDHGINRDQWCQLYAVRQAMLWVQGAFAAAPFDVVMSQKVQPITGIQAG